MSEQPICPHCGRGDRQIKAGTAGGNQRYRCGHCARRYMVAVHGRGYPPEVRQKILDMRAEGASIEAIVRSCGVSRRTIFQWLSAHRNGEAAATGQATAVPEPPSPHTPARRASIKDVATRAGVSVSTVSNFLNRAGRMSDATEKRIRAAIEELHFAPNSLTRAIRQRRTRILGLITYGMSDLEKYISIANSVLVGVNDACRESNYDFLVYTNWWQAEKHYTGVNFLGGQVDGLIWVGPSIREPLLERVGAAGLPSVALLSRHVPPGVGYVNADNVGGMELVVEHLIALGHRRLAYIGPEDLSNALDRRAGFWKSVDAAGLSDTCTEFYPRTNKWRMENYGNVLKAWAAAPDRPTAIVAVDDMFANFAIECFEALGYRVPEDFSVTGFNNMPSSANGWRLGLTGIRQPIREMALTAGRQLIDVIEHGSPDRPCAITVGVELIVGGTTGRAPRPHD